MRHILWCRNDRPPARHLRRRAARVGRGSPRRLECPATGYKSIHRSRNDFRASEPASKPAGISTGLQKIRKYTDGVRRAEPVEGTMTALPANPPCPRRDRWIRGCRFEPRYDLGEPRVTKVQGLPGGTAKIIEASKPRTYVRDVCVTCGRTVERKA